MADIAQLGFAADTSDLRDAKSALDALPAAAGRAERSSAKLSAVLDKAGAAADKLMAGATALVSAVDKMSAVMDRQAAAAGNAGNAQTKLGYAVGTTSINFNTLAIATSKTIGVTNTMTTAAVGEAKALEKVTDAAISAAEGTSKLDAANDNTVGSLKRVAKQADTTASKLAAINMVKSGDFSVARDRGADIAAYGQQLDNLRAKFNPLYSVIRQYKTNVAEIREANKVGAISVDEMTAALSKQRQAALTAIGAIKGTSVPLKGAASGAKLTANEMLNLTRQLSDVGVTAAMGMSPLMILIQQGPQIADIFQSAAQRGIGFSAVLKSIAASAWAAIAPFAPLIAVIAALGAGIGVAFALGAREIDKSAGDISKSLGLTEKQLERVKKSGVETTVTLGDTFAGFAGALKEHFEKAFNGPLAAISNAWNKTLDFITRVGGTVIIALVAGMTGAMQAIVNAWSRIPAAIGSFIIEAANLVRSGVEKMINGSIALINALVSGANAALAAFGADSRIPLLGDVSISQLENPYRGAGKALGTALADGFTDGVKAANTGMNKLFARAGELARARRKGLILDAAGDAEKGKKGPKAPKSDTEKFGDITTRANQEIDAINAKTKAVGMSTQAAAELEYKTKLLNEAEKANIALTPQMRREIDALAKRFGDATAAYEYAKAMDEIRKSAATTIEQLKQEQSMVRLNEEATIRAKYAYDLLNQAKAKGITLSAADQIELEQTAAKMADIAIQTKRMKDALDFARDTTKGFVSDLRSGLSQSENAFKAFGNAALNVLNKVIDKLLEVSIDAALGNGGGGAGGFLGALLGGLKAGIGGLGKGGDLGGGYSTAGVSAGLYARGGAFDKTGIVSSPTAFGIGGGKRGIMGEAGPEGVLPLSRGPDGSLGVQMYGDQGGGAVINAPVTVNNDNRVTGAVSSGEIVAMQQRSAAQTAQQLRRELPAIIQMYQRDGTIV